MRPEKLYFVDILEAAGAIQRFIEPINADEFLHNEIRQSAVLQKLIVIGEAAARLPKDYQNDILELNGLALPVFAISPFMITLLSYSKKDKVPSI
jgi:uncharacterized protein with HEPN domain